MTFPTAIKDLRLTRQDGAAENSGVINQRGDVIWQTAK
jgi:hypothetical protein